MKKKLESRLQELAQQILTEGSSKNTKQLKESARELYDQLLVLEYLENQIEGQFMDQSLDSKSYREQNWFKDPVPVPEPDNKEELIEPAIEKIKDIVAQMPTDSEKVDRLLEEVLPKKKFQKNDLEEFASHYQETPVFERKETATNPTPVKSETRDQELSQESSTGKPKSLNETMAKGLTFGLNDRLAFVTHLFNGNEEDFKRVISQLNTFGTHQEALDFIKNQVKPDYNHWQQKEDFESRFMAMVEKKFN